MASSKNYYELLGIPKDASEEQVRKAFRSLAMEWHPDRNRSTDAEERFKEINEAYQVLIDPSKRQMYDQYGRVDIDPNGGFPGRGFDGSDFQGGVGDIFDAFFGGFGGGGQNDASRGNDIQYAMTITFKEAAFGVEKELGITRNEICSTCNGDLAAPGTSTDKCGNCNGAGKVRRAQNSIFGQFVQVVACNVCRGRGQTVKTPCPTCKASGRERQTRNVMVNVPAGVEDGMRVRLSGEGDVGSSKGRAGDMYVTLSVKSHPLFRREKEHLVFDLPLNVAHAALGKTIEVPMLDGETEEFVVPAGVQSGAVLRKKGKGVRNLNNSRYGDLVALVTIITPKQMGARTRELFDELAVSLEVDEEAHSPSNGKSWVRKLKDVLAGENC